jgi:hypothetical protein
MVLAIRPEKGLPSELMVPSRLPPSEPGGHPKGRALLGLGIETPDVAVLRDTAGVVLKYKEDIERLQTLDAASLLRQP